MISLQNKMGIAIRIVLVTLLVCWTYKIYADETKGLIEVLPRWEAGEQIRYEIVKTRQKMNDEVVTFDMTSRTELTIEVIEAHSEGFTLAWILGETQFDDPAVLENPTVKQMSNLLKNQRIILELDSQAAILGVKNWKQLQERSSEIVDVMAEVLEEEGTEKRVIETVIQQVRAVFAAKEQIELFCLREAHLMFMAIGISLSPSEPLRFEDKLPNPFGGEPFPTQASFELGQIDKEADRTSIKWNQVFDPDEARRIMQATLTTLAQQMGRPVTDADALTNFSIEDQAIFLFTTSTGWLQSATHKRTTTAGNQSQVDKMTVKKLSDE